MHNYAVIINVRHSELLVYLEHKSEKTTIKNWGVIRHKELLVISYQLIVVSCQICLGGVGPLRQVRQVRRAGQHDTRYRNAPEVLRSYWS